MQVANSLLLHMVFAVCLITMLRTSYNILTNYIYILSADLEGDGGGRQE